MSMASNYVYSYGHQLWKSNREKLFDDVDHLISPDAVNKFRHALLDLDQPDPVHHLVSLLMEKLYHVVEPLILYPQTQPHNSSSCLFTKIESLPADQQSDLQLEITNFAKAALAEAKSKNLQTIQIRLVLKVKRMVKPLESTNRNCDRCGDEELECPICMDKLNDDNKATSTHCFHVFHQDCLFKWNQINSTCPMCRSML